MTDDNKKHDQPLSKPDPETLHTTDPQENMEGPVSSMMQNIKETAEESDVKRAPENEDRKDTSDPDSDSE
jgi:hypothetical protein